jgi:hypothetical protein
MLFELHNTNVDVTSGSLEVTWCLDKELLELMRAEKDPEVIISVVPLDKDGDPITRKEVRFSFPLKQMMGYIYFRMPGKNRIYAYIEKHGSGVMHRSSGQYDTDIIDYDGEYTNYVAGYEYSENHLDNDGNPVLDNNGSQLFTKVIRYNKPSITPFEVEVPEEYFGEEPAEWEKNWVLWLLGDRGMDQCAFRKRRLFAYLVQPFIFAGNLLIKVIITLGALLLGARGFNFKYLLHPLTHDLVDVLANQFEGGSIFIRPKPALFPKTVGQHLVYGFKRCWSLPFMPLVMMTLYFFTVKHLWLPVLAAALILCVIFLFFGVLLNMPGITGWIIDWFNEKMNAIGGQNDIEDLICTGVPNKKPKHRSVRLRYLALKSKVCKPFAG